MATEQLQADTVFVVRLTSYGFFHSGRERLRVQVLKRTWEHIPGSTLYGAVAAALIRLDGVKDDDRPIEEDPSFDKGLGGYHELLRAVREHRVRFTPLLPLAPGEGICSGEAYCVQVMRLHAALYGDGPEKPRRQEQALFHTTPHAPRSRGTEQIHGDQLFAVRTHRPLLKYSGFIFADAELEPLLQRALRLFPFIPVGGRGKFSLVEGRLVNSGPLNDFTNTLREWASGRNGWLRLLTPMMLGGGQATELLVGSGREVVMARPRRYRVWRTGRYFDAVRDTFGRATGMEPGEGEDPAAPFLPGGRESESAQAVPERSRFRLLEGDDAARWFVEGVGHPSWTYLGWGQVVIE
jgi:hypothetical protein